MSKDMRDSPQANLGFAANTFNKGNIYASWGYLLGVVGGFKYGTPWATDSGPRAPDTSGFNPSHIGHRWQWPSVWEKTRKKSRTFKFHLVHTTEGTSYLVMMLIETHKEFSVHFHWNSDEYSITLSVLSFAGRHNPKEKVTSERVVILHMGPQWPLPGGYQVLRPKHSRSDCSPSRRCAHQQKPLPPISNNYPQIETLVFLLEDIGSIHFREGIFGHFVSWYSDVPSGKLT